jgi:hypothetical protein
MGLTDLEDDLTAEELEERANNRAFVVQSKIRGAYQALKNPDFPDLEWVGLQELRADLARKGFDDRAEQDAQLMELLKRGAIRLIPEENQKTITAEDAAAAINVSGEMKHLIGPNDDFLRRKPHTFQGDVRTGRTRSRRDTPAVPEPRAPKAVDTPAPGNSDGFLPHNLVPARAADAPVSQPREKTRAEIASIYSQLADRPNDLVSLARLRASLPHISREELDAVLKQMDRERLIHLDPDPNTKAIPKEGKDAAVRLGGEDKHFISIDRSRIERHKPDGPGEDAAITGDDTQDPDGSDK